MVLPGTYAILCPIMIGLLVGPACLAGVLAGSIASGCMLGIMMSNAGGAWDNSKKYIEIECTPEGDDKGFDESGENPSYKIKANGFPTIPKHTVHHDACVVGDTVGDPFKDTSGPALNILIKLMSMVSLTIAPLLAGNEAYDDWVFGLIPVILAVLITVVHTCKFGSVLADVEYPEFDQQGNIVGA
jgi:inorganic pyrophosphatase